MAFFTQADARAAARRAHGHRSIKAVITESLESYKAATRFDIFLSHSSSDAELIIGIKALLEERGKRVYVDSEEQRAAVEAWLKSRSELTSVEVSPLLDVWYPEKPLNPVA